MTPTHRLHLGLVLIALTLSVSPASARAQPLQECRVGQAVSDAGKNGGTIVGGRDGMCLVKFGSGQTQAWIAADKLHLLSPPGAPGPQPDSGSGTASGAAATGLSQNVVVLRPEVSNRLVFHADALGHIMIVANINGAPVHLLVDTGATLLSLTPEDAAAASLKRGELTFNQMVYTGNGPVHAARATLREVRIGQLQVANVDAAVIETLKQSVLGMSFLRRLKGFEMHDGLLQLDW